MNFSVLMISGFAALTIAIRLNPTKKITSARMSKCVFSLIQPKKSSRLIFENTNRLITPRIISAVACEARSFRSNWIEVNHQKMAPQRSSPNGRSKKTPREGSFFIAAKASGRLTTANTRLNRYQLSTPIIIT